MAHEMSKGESIMNNMNISEQLMGLIVGLIAAVLIEFMPALEPMRDSLIAILLVFAAYILGKSYENGKKAEAAKE